MKVIFLDLDGVLNSVKYDRERDISTRSYIDGSRLPLLKEIVEETGAKIVFSSAWRKHWNEDTALCDEEGKYIVDLFASYGLTIYDKTPEFELFTPRKQEIAAWLNDHPEVKKFVILDDARFGWEELAPYFVGTNMYIGRGLEPEHVEKAIAILNEEA